MDWLVNKIPPWAAYQVFMYGRLILLNHLIGIRLLRVGETWHQLFSKCVIKVVVPESTHAYKDDQLCAGLKVLIDGSVYGGRSIWDANASE